MRILRPESTPISPEQQSVEDSRLLHDAAEAFEKAYEADFTKHATSDHPKSGRWRMNWRDHPNFSPSMKDADYLMSILGRECRAALEDQQYSLVTALAHTPKRTPFLYTRDEKATLEARLRLTMYPGISELGEKGLQQILDGRGLPDNVFIGKMQEVALMREYLSALCLLLKDSTNVEFTPRELTFTHIRNRLHDLSVHPDDPISAPAEQMLKVSDFIKRRTAEIADDINAHAGKPVLEKANIVDFNQARGRE